MGKTGGVRPAEIRVVACQTIPLSGSVRRGKCTAVDILSQRADLTATRSDARRKMGSCFLSEAIVSKSILAPIITLAEQTNTLRFIVGMPFSSVEISLFA